MQYTPCTSVNTDIPTPKSCLLIKYDYCRMMFYYYTIHAICIINLHYIHLYQGLDYYSHSHSIPNTPFSPSFFDNPAVDAWDILSFLIDDSAIVEFSDV